MTIFWDGESDEAGDMKPMSVAHLLPHYNDPAGCDGYRFGFLKIVIMHTN